MRRFRGGALVGSALMLTASAFAGFASNESFLPAIGRGSGNGGLQFFATVWATNLTGAPVHFTFDFLKQGQANTSPASFADTLAPGQTKVYENVVESKLGLTSAIGGARITADGEVLVAERIYNQSPGTDLGATQGLFFAGVPKSFSISVGQSTSIQGINQGGGENFRYNFALVETGGGSPTVSVQLFDGNGTLLGQKAYILQPYEQLQPNVAELDASVATTNARITATVTGGSGSVLLAGAQLAAESLDSSGFEMSFRGSLLAGGGTAGVSSLNGLTGDVSLIAGNNVTLTTVGNGIKIDAGGAGGGSGLTSVTHDTTLTGNGTVALPLGLKLPFAATDDSPMASFSVTNTSDNTAYNVAILGIGTTAQVKGYLAAGYGGVIGTAATANGIGVLGANTQNGNFGYLGYTTSGIYGVSPNGGAAGILGESDNGSGWAVEGANGITGSIGYLGGHEYGVLGIAPTSGSPVYAGDFQGDVLVSGHLKADGVSLAIAPSPIAPEMEIRLGSPSGPESGTYFRGSGRIVNGLATIDVPEAFRLLTSETGMTVQLTPVGDFAALVCVKKALDRIVVKGSADVEFDYLVQGLRRGSEGFVSIAPNEDFIPRSQRDPEFARHLDPESLRALVATGILNSDGTVNLETAHRLGWDKRPGWNEELSTLPRGSR